MADFLLDPQLYLYSRVKLPTITGVNAVADKYTYTVKLNGTFNTSMLGATVTDKHAVTGADMTKGCAITYEGKVDTTWAQDYKVVVTATDSKGAKTEKTVIVTVKDYKDNTVPIAVRRRKGLKDLLGE